MKIIDYRTNTDQTVTLEREDGEKLTYPLGDERARFEAIRVELVKCSIAKAEKQPEKEIISAQAKLFESELIAPLEVIPETFTRARQSSPFVDLSALTKAFCFYTYKDVSRKNARLRSLMQTISIAVAERLTENIVGEAKYKTMYEIRSSIDNLPLDVAERVAALPVNEQIKFFPKRLGANNG